ncbi:hypothetical protein DUNSADRAFT_8788 [Dunaliella salina]|uniref:Uncharacterized protein n=1 Tax=Dunaliella salina TaxID=3046 RepID=A0ABQ7GIR1_DUNSA|nr:hypothetical protein DUNSADRAFT_8788 [Dunaliella salina]|eukprot:KAF5834495.1 hypothetical protein DUNSADRAFT_8788 [Dunaliella salina]
MEAAVVPAPRPIRQVNEVSQKSLPAPSGWRKIKIKRDCKSYAGASTLWEAATITDFDPTTNTHLVKWKSGGTQQLYLGSVRFAWMGDAPEDAAVRRVIKYGGGGGFGAVGGGYGGGMGGDGWGGHGHERGARMSWVWVGERKWFAGVVASYDPARDRHRVAYQDGDSQAHCLRNEAVIFLDPGSTEPFASSSPVCVAPPTQHQHKQHALQQPGGSSIASKQRAPAQQQQQQQQHKANGSGAGWQNGKYANGDAAPLTKHRRMHSGGGEEQLGGPSPSPPPGSSLFFKSPTAPFFKQHPLQQQSRSGGSQNVRDHAAPGFAPGGPASTRRAAGGGGWGGSGGGGTPRGGGRDDDEKQPPRKRVAAELSEESEEEDEEEEEDEDEDTDMLCCAALCAFVSLGPVAPLSLYFAAPTFL